MQRLVIQQSFIEKGGGKKEGDSVSMVTGLRLSLTYTYPAPDVREVEEEMEQFEEHTAIHSPQLTPEEKAYTSSNYFMILYFLWKKLDPKALLDKPAWQLPQWQRF